LLEYAACKAVAVIPSRSLFKLIGRPSLEAMKRRSVCGWYCLWLRGGPFAEEDDEARCRFDPAFLMQQKSILEEKKLGKGSNIVLVAKGLKLVSAANNNVDLWIKRRHSVNNGKQVKRKGMVWQHYGKNQVGMYDIICVVAFTACRRRRTAISRRAAVAIAAAVGVVVADVVVGGGVVVISAIR